MILKYSDRFHLLKAGKLNQSDIIKSFNQQIQRYKYLNAFNFVEQVTGKSKIDDIEKFINHSGKFTGMVFSIKDIFSEKNKPLTCSSNILRNFKSNYNSTVVENIKSGNGLLIGRTNCDEFAMGSTNETSIFGPVLNPFSSEHVAGGSSGGAAVSVDKEMCDIAIGSDTGGSVRVPASYCGVIGFKPTYGAISRYGMVSFAPAFDTVGLISKDFEVIKKVFQNLIHTDKLDMTTNKIKNYNLTSNCEAKVLVPENIFNLKLNSEIEKVFRKLIKNNNFESKFIKYFNDAVKAYYTLSLCQTASNLSRYDGIRFGHSEKSDNVYKIISESRSAGFGLEIKKRIILGNYILLNKRDLLEAALKLRAFLFSLVDDIFNQYDFIVLPTTLNTAPRLAEIKSQEEMYSTDILTTFANLLELPSISIPCHFDINGMPFGIQIMTSKYSDKNLLEYSHYFLEKIL